MKEKGLQMQIEGDPDRGDITQSYKVYHNQHRMEPILEIDTNISRQGHSLKPLKHHTSKTARSHFSLKEL